VILWQDPITDTAKELATKNDYTVAGVLAAVAFVAVVGLAWFVRIYIQQRDKDEKRYQKFTEQMIPLLTEFKTTTDELKNLIREFLRNTPHPGGPQ
jgi:hypothetical protein